MSTIVTRAGKGSPLTHTEVDNNFTNLNTDKLESGSTASSLAISSADINGGTIDGTAIGSSSASTGAFTSLSDSGNLTFTGTGNRITGDFSNSTHSNRVLFQTSTSNGSTVVGFIPNGTSTQAVLNLYDNSDATNAGTLNLLSNSTEKRISAGLVGTGTYLPLTMYTGGSERLRIDTSGNVGIGTSSPNARLDVAGSSYVSAAGTLSFRNNVPEDYGYIGTGSITTGGGASNFGLRANTGSMIFATGGSTERMRLDSSGNLGIGVTPTSGYKLDVAGSIKLGGAFDETVFAVSGTTPALSPANGTIQTWTLSANSTPTAGTWNDGESMTLMVLDGTAFTITWTSVAVTWVGGSAPTLDTTKQNVIELWKVGGVVYGAFVGAA